MIRFHALLLVALSSCDPRPSPSPQVSASASVSASVSVSASISASASISPAPLSPLSVPGFSPSLVAAARAPKAPLLVVAHGHGEPPDRICAVFQRIVRARAYVLCLAGTRWPISGLYTYVSERALGEELDAALIAFHARFPEADASAAVFAGFSMGATFAVAPLVARAGKLPRAIMIEGGVTDWSPARIRAYAATGGLHVLFACGLRRRTIAAQTVVEQMRAVGLRADVVLGADANGVEAGHTYEGDVARVVEERFDELVDGDERWKEPPPSLKPR